MKLPSIALTLLAALIGLAGTVQNAQAQAVQRIAAVVNDDVVTTKDVSERVEVVLASTGIPGTAQNRERLSGQVLRKLIDERLMLQEAERLGLSVSQADIDRAVDRIEQQNNMPEGGFDNYIRANNLARDSVMNQFKAELAWGAAVRRTMGSRVNVTEQDVEQVRQRLRANLGKPQRRIAEIFVSVPGPAEEAEARRTAERLIDALRNQGAAFQAMARQFSDSATAAVGGDLGWIPQGTLEEELEAALARLQPGQVSPPVRTLSGYHILLLRDRRTSGDRSAADIVELAQIFLPAVGPKAIADAERERLARTVSANAKSCDDMANMAVELGTPLSGNMGEVRVGDLNPQIRPAAADLPEGRASAPLRIEDGIVVLMVCSRQSAGDLPSPEQVKQRLEADRLEALARRYMRDLRREAFIEIRV